MEERTTNLAVDSVRYGDAAAVVALQLRMSKQAASVPGDPPTGRVQTRFKLCYPTSNTSVSSNEETRKCTVIVSYKPKLVLVPWWRRWRSDDPELFD
jgi:hypothetical protein